MHKSKGDSMLGSTLIKRREAMSRGPHHGCHGGAGSLDLVGVLSHQELAGRQLRFLHDNTLPPGVSIGLHDHLNDEEYYYVVAGKGTMTLDGRRYHVSAGDITAVFPGGRHALENTGPDDLRIIVFSISSHGGITRWTQPRYWHGLRRYTLGRIRRAYFKAKCRLCKSSS